MKIQSTRTKNFLYNLYYMYAKHRKYIIFPVSYTYICVCIKYAFKTARTKDRKNKTRKILKKLQKNEKKLNNSMGMYATRQRDFICVFIKFTEEIYSITVCLCH